MLKIDQNTRLLDLSKGQINNTSNNDLFENHLILKSLLMSNMGLVNIPTGFFRSLQFLFSLDLSYNKFIVLYKDTFIGLNSLRELRLTGNFLISYIEPYTFRTMKFMTSLNLNDLSLKSISKATFDGLSNLRFLNLSGNAISTIEDGAIQGLVKLQHIDISQNKIVNVNATAFRNLFAVDFFVSDHFSFCCFTPFLNSCVPTPDRLSSCSDLNRHENMSFVMWIMSVLGIFGNFGLIIFRVLSKQPLNRDYEIILNSLSIIHIIISLNLVFVAYTDSMFRDKYALHQITWVQSFLCDTGGFLVHVSIVPSSLLVTFLSCSTTWSVSNFTNLSKWSLIFVCASSWAIGIILTTVPKLIVMNEPDRITKHYSSGACFAIPFYIERDFGGPMIATVVASLQAICMFVTVICLIKLIAIIIKRRMDTDLPESEDIVIAKRLVVIVLIQTSPTCFVWAVGKFCTFLSNLPDNNNKVRKKCTEKRTVRKPVPGISIQNYCFQVLVPLIEFGYTTIPYFDNFCELYLLLFVFQRFI